MGRAGLKSYTMYICILDSLGENIKEVVTNSNKNLEKSSKTPVRVCRWAEIYLT